MRRQGKVHCARDILSPFRFFALDYYCRRYCIFQEDTIMTQQHTPRNRPVVAMTTLCVIFAIFCCYLPQADSLGSDCYTITGLDYRGDQDEIGLPPEAGDLLNLTTCLPWNSSVESKKPRARERGIGNHNYCRNPDGDIMPWCKIGSFQGSDGAWGYCHLPKCKVPGYIGCFPDRGSPSSALDAAVILHKDMTVSACIDFCRRNGFKYAGLEAGHACYCGDEGYDRYGKSAERGTHCAHKCFGNKGQPCGGDGYVDVYRADIGSCGTSSPLRVAAGAVYSPGYPDSPGSSAMMTSFGATEVMLKKYKDKLESDDRDTSAVAKAIAASPNKPHETCEWVVDIRQATEIKLLVRKIDPKRKLGGVIEIEASSGSYVSVSTSEDSSVTSTIVWILESSKSRNDVEVVVPPKDEIQVNAAGHGPKWSTEMAEKDWPKYTIPSKSLESVISVKGEGFTVRFIKTSDLISALKNAFDFPRHRSKSRKKSSEWSRFVIEYEATFPNGFIYRPELVPADGQTNENIGTESENTNALKKNRRGKHFSHSQSSETDISDVLSNTRFTISQEDAIVIQQAVSGSDSASVGENRSQSPIKIEVFVEKFDPKNSENGKPMSDVTTQTLLVVVLIVTLSILVLFAISMLYRRKIFPRKGGKSKGDHHYSPGHVVACPQDGDNEKSGSNSNLSSSSTADSVLLTDTETKHSSKSARRSPPPVSPETIKDLIELLNRPGLVQTHPPLEAEQLKQASGHHFFSSEGNSRYDDVTPLPGPCPHCCGCADEGRGHRHGDSCRAHHNQGKHGRSQMGMSTRCGKNPRGLSIRSTKQASMNQPSLAPPLSPISEVSSVASSMISLPITSANSQTSLLKQSTKASPQKQIKKDVSKHPGPETQGFNTSDNDAEIANNDNDLKSEFVNDKNSPKSSFLDRKGDKLRQGRYLGGALGACYDSGYATSNCEEEEYKTLASMKHHDVIRRVNETDTVLDT